MSKALTVETFDYSDVDKDTKGKLLSLARDIHREKLKHSESGMEIGKAVATAHALLAEEGRDGRFSQWVQSECGFSRQTAYNYLWTWQRFGNCKTILQFDAGALYALASPKAPEKAAKEAEKLADKGVKITLDKAKELLDRFREVAAKPPKAHQPEAQSAPQDESVPTKSDAPAAGPCPHGGEHDYDDEACRQCHDPKPLPPRQYKDSFDFGDNESVGKLFSKLLESLRQSVLLLDDINRLSPNEKLRQEIFDSLELANKDVLAWRKNGKK